MPHLVIRWTSEHETKHEFDDLDAGEVDVALDAIEEGGGATFPTEDGRLTIPPGQVKWILVDSLPLSDEPVMEVTP